MKVACEAATMLSHQRKSSEKFILLIKYSNKSGTPKWQLRGNNLGWDTTHQAKRRHMGKSTTESHVVEGFWQVSVCDKATLS